jgi:hypothetical protein
VRGRRVARRGSIGAEGRSRARGTGVCVRVGVARERMVAAGPRLREQSWRARALVWKPAGEGETMPRRCLAAALIILKKRQEEIIA